MRGQGLAASNPGASARAAVPRRVRQAIAAQQAASERLIGWFQLAVVAVFAVLYAVSPKTAPVDAEFNPVPVALGLYFLFTLLRLALAYRRWLPAWFLALSVIIDVALLMLLIWSFHLQYMQPPAFYLKAPTVLYLFIFIALRTLRFEPGYVLLTGLAAIVGWGGLVAYAALVDPTMPITRDYVEYMTSAKILLGAEFDKLITIGLVTVILAVALHRGQGLLVASVREAQAAADLSRFFTPEIAREITASERRVRPGEGVLRRAAVLVTDLEGFTRLSQGLSPNEVMGLLTEYQARLVPVIRAHGGSVDKFMGDGILATFGAALPRERYAAHAFEAVLDLIDAVAAWNRERQGVGGGAPPVAVRAAVAVGEVVFGAVGDADRLEYTVIGNAVNLAAKLEKHTRREGVMAVTTADALALARRQGFVGRPGCGEGGVRRRRIAGLDGEVELVVLAERTAA